MESLDFTPLKNNLNNLVDILNQADISNSILYLNRGILCDNTEEGYIFN